MNGLKMLFVHAGTSLALDFVADFVVAGRAAIDPEVAVRVLEHLATPDQAAEITGPPRSPLPEGRGSPSGGGEREDRFVAVLMNSGLATGAAVPDWVTHDILWLAKRAGFLQAEAQVCMYLNLITVCGCLCAFSIFGMCCCWPTSRWGKSGSQRHC